MKKLIIISALSLLSSCSKQVNFEKLLPQAFSEPAELIINHSSEHRLSDYFPGLENIDSLTCRNACIIQSQSDENLFRVESSLSHPFYVIDIWKKQARTSLIVIDSLPVTPVKSLFITSALNNRDQINILSNKPVDEWLVFWQNVEVPLSLLDVSEKSITIPIPENSRWVDHSELRILAFSKGELSNMSSVYLARDKVIDNNRQIRKSFNIHPFTPIKADKVTGSDRFQIVQNLENERLEWLAGDEFTLLDDDDIYVYVRTYMGATSVFAFNKTDSQVKKQVPVPANVKMGNLKTYFNQSVKQTGENIVIKLMPHAHEIATTEIL